MAKSYEISLNSEEIEGLFQSCPAQQYPQTTETIYQGHIPIVCYYLIQGSILLKDKKGKVVETLSQGSVVGLKEIIFNHEMLYSIEIREKSSVKVLDKTTLLERIQKDTELANKLHLLPQ